MYFEHVYYHRIQNINQKLSLSVKINRKNSLIHIVLPCAFDVHVILPILYQ